MPAKFSKYEQIAATLAAAVLANPNVKLGSDTASAELAFQVYNEILSRLMNHGSGLVRPARKTSS